jgi:hypothetical protein
MKTKAWIITSPHGKPVPTLEGALAFATRGEALRAHGWRTSAIDDNGQLFGCGGDWHPGWKRMRKCGYRAVRVVVS